MAGSAIAYHRQTCYDRGTLRGHGLDWPNQPTLFKAYQDLPQLDLPDAPAPPECPLATVLDGPSSLGDPSIAAPAPGLPVLSLILRLTCCLTARAPHAGGDFYYRSNASAGALYPNEIYVGAFGVDGLESGIYHFGIAGNCLTRLRSGDWRHLLLENGGPSGRIAPAAVVFLSGLFFRSAWKYRDRAYRYVLLDAGHLLQNLLLAAAASDQPAFCTLHFDDRLFNTLLGFDDRREATLACVHLAAGAPQAPVRFSRPSPLPPAVTAASRVSRHEVIYPAIETIHRAAEASNGAAERSGAAGGDIGPAPRSWLPIPSASDADEPAGYPRILHLRRSRRNFVERPLDRARFSKLLGFLCQAADQDRVAARLCGRSLQTGFLTGAVEGLAAGFYLLDTGSRRMGLVREGNFTAQMAEICLGQRWLATAALHFVFLADLAEVERTWSARGYRLAMLGAGRLGQALYLGATATGLGCCGIGAFFDTEAAALLGLQANAYMLYLVATGPVKRV